MISIKDYLYAETLGQISGEIHDTSIFNSRTLDYYTLHISFSILRTLEHSKMHEMYEHRNTHRMQRIKVYGIEYSQI